MKEKLLEADRIVKEYSNNPPEIIYGDARFAGVDILALIQKKLEIKLCSIDFGNGESWTADSQRRLYSTKHIAGARDERIECIFVCVVKDARESVPIES